MINRLSEKICLKDKALLWMYIHYWLCQINIWFSTPVAYSALRGGTLAFRRCHGCLEMKNKYNNLLTHSPQWSSDRTQSVKAVKKCLEGDPHAVQTGLLLLGCHAQHVLPSERELSGPLFHSTTTDDCDIIFVLQAWYSAQLLHPNPILWHSGLSTHCSPSCCNTGSQVRSLVFSSHRKALYTFHSTTAAWHSHSSCGEKAHKHPIAYTKPIAKSCFTFESKW